MREVYILTMSMKMIIMNIHALKYVKAAVDGPINAAFMLKPCTEYKDLTGYYWEWNFV